MIASRLLTFAVVVFLACPALAESPDPFADPTDITIGFPGILAVDPQLVSAKVRDTSLAPQPDLGSLLRELPGVSGSRMGGHGIDPVIRGQRETQINTSIDGAYIHGGCPNRMDPPVSFASPSEDSTLVVTRGYTTVTNGPGAPGGTIEVRRNRNALRDAGLGSSIEESYSTNGSQNYVSPRVEFGDSRKFAAAAVSSFHAANYRDGGGSLVRSAVERESGAFETGIFLDEGSVAFMSADIGQVRDALFPGAGMDEPETRHQLYRVGMDRSLGDATVSALFYAAFVDHLMDNYSLRSRTQGFMRAPTDSDSIGARLSATFTSGSHALTVGLEHHRVSRDGHVFSSSGDRSSVTNLAGILWPDTTLDQSGVFIEDQISLSDALRLTVGSRLDHARFDTDEHGRRFMLPMPTSGAMAASTSPGELYQSYYGTDAVRSSENNLSGLVRFEFDLDRDWTVALGANRVMRTADATERSSATIGMNARVGNPGLAPEDHRQLNFGVSHHSDMSSSKVTVYASDVKNFIFQDRARGQEGILQANGATVYRNIDATLFGVETAHTVQLSDTLQFETDLTYTFGQNNDLDQPLPQIPPLFGASRLRLQYGAWSLVPQVRYAAHQSRADTDPTSGSARDARETPGWAVADISASYELDRQTKIAVGVANMFDALYAYHLNRANTVINEEVQVNEPGRTLFVRISASF